MTERRWFCAGGAATTRDPDDPLLWLCPDCSTPLVSAVDEPMFPPHLVEGDVVTFLQAMPDADG